jgi:hypothetical protein
MQRYLTSRRCKVRPIADAAQMPAVAQSDHGDAGLGRFRGAEAAGKFSHDLAEPAVAVDGDGIGAMTPESGSLHQPRRAHPFQILATRMTPANVADGRPTDQATRHRARSSSATGALHDRGDELPVNCSYCLNTVPGSSVTRVGKEA